MAPIVQNGPIARELPWGGRVGRFTVVRRLARGGMAEVYLAREEGPAGVERLVALKLILPHMADESRFLSMFKTEARVAATLDHPNIAQVRDAGEVDGEPYLAMEFVHGRTLHGMLRAASDNGVHIPLGCALALVIGACAGLHYAHERRDLAGTPLNIVHRDVSPSNLMCRYDGTVKLLDFGIAKAASQTSATATGFFKGKAGYMSPEQCADEPIDRRSDVFNLGILAYEVTTARRAFFGDNPVAVINKIANGRFTPPSLLVDGYPRELEEIVMKAMSPAAGARFSTAALMQLELEAFARSHQLDVSSAGLAGLMRALFGEQPYPSVPDVAYGEGFQTEVATPSVLKTITHEPKPPKSWAPVAVVGLVVAGLGAAAWSYAREDPPQRSGSQAPALETPAPADAPTLAATPAPAAAVVENAAPAPAPTAATDAPPAAVPEASPQAKAAPSAKRKKPRRKRGGTSSSKRRKGPKGMYP